MTKPEDAAADSPARRVATEILVSVVFGRITPYVVYVLLHTRLGEVP